MVIELDLNKAYDRVMWDFLSKVILKMGFNHKWVNLIMKCMTAVKFEIVASGVIGCKVSPQIGLH